jgi:hypothetical protein
MKNLLIAVFPLLLSQVAIADSLICANGKETQIEFYSREGKVTFQMGAPYHDEYLYLLGNCYSENDFGLPYSCEPFDSEKVILNLIKGPQGQPIAELTTRFEDGTSTRELISCNHFDLK